MEPGFIIVGVVSVVGLIASLAIVSRANGLRRLEEQNIGTIASLKAQLSTGRTKLQEIRQGRYTPTKAELDRINPKLDAIDTPSSEEPCFFCDEPLHKDALVCQACARINTNNLDAVAKNDARVLKALSNV